MSLPARHIRQATWLLLCLLFALLLQLPASLAAERLNRICAGQCLLARSHGYWWSGDAHLFLRSTGNSRANEDWLDIGPLRWSLHWGYPLRLTVGVAGGEALLEARWQTQTLTAQRLTLPASWLLSLPVLRLPAGEWSGQVTLAEGAVVLADQPRWQSRGRLVWQQAASSLLPDLPAGALLLQWQADAAQGGELRMSSAQGDPLTMAGVVRLAPGGMPSELDLAVSPAPGSPTRLTRQLAAVAQADPAQPGRYLLQHRFR